MKIHTNKEYSLEISRNKSLVGQIVIVDGMWGSGKSILGPVIGSFERCENIKILEMYEHICTLSALGKFDRDACISLMRLHADMVLFNNMISREVNLRFKDDTGLLSNPKPLEYIKRLFRSYETSLLEKEIKLTKPILNLMVHNFLWLAKYGFEAFQDNLFLIEMVRHPVYMVEHWYNYIERCGTDPTEFDLWINYSGNSLPWFCFGWEELYKKSNVMDCTILSIQKLLEMGEKTVKNLSNNEKNHVIFIPFESFVLEPDPWIKRLTEFSGVGPTTVTHKMLKKQKCPRRAINAGKGHASYGFNKKTTKLSEKNDYDRRWEFIKKRASPMAVDVLTTLSEQYARKYTFPRPMPWEN
jgi:hypothetical protein